MSAWNSTKFSRLDFAELHRTSQKLRREFTKFNLVRSNEVECQRNSFLIFHLWFCKSDLHFGSAFVGTWAPICCNPFEPINVSGGSAETADSWECLRSLLDFWSSEALRSDLLIFRKELLIQEFWKASKGPSEKPLQRASKKASRVFEKVPTKSPYKKSLKRPLEESREKPAKPPPKLSAWTASINSLNFNRFAALRPIRTLLKCSSNAPQRAR